MPEVKLLKVAVGLPLQNPAAVSCEFRGNDKGEELPVLEIAATSLDG